MTTTINKTVFIDLDGVIRVWKRQSPTTQIPIKEIQSIAFSPQLLIPAITGQITDPQWRNLIISALSNQYPQEIATQAVSNWSAPHGKKNHEVIDVLSRLNLLSQLTLITNATTRLNSDLQKLGILPYFKHIINSSAIGFAKPSPEIYSHALQINQITPDQALFIDDSLENCHAAESLHISAHHYQNPQALQQFLHESLA